MREPDFNFKVWDYESKRLGDMVCADWGVAGKGKDKRPVLVSCHVDFDFKDDNSHDVKKFYPSKKYGDDIEILPMSTKVDKEGNRLFHGCILVQGVVRCVVEYTDIHGFRIFIISPESENMLSFDSPSISTKMIIDGDVYSNPDEIRDTSLWEKYYGK